MVVGVLILSGCAHKKSLYYWGNYEDQVYVMYSDPGKISVEEQLIKLQEDGEKAKAKNKPLPPGYYSHMGYLYFLSGKKNEALQFFNTEKALYPESSVYMNFLIAKIK